MVISYEFYEMILKREDVEALVTKCYVICVHIIFMT